MHMIVMSRSINVAKVEFVFLLQMFKLLISFNCISECGCGNFNSNFLCAACNNHWEQHETFFERGSEREQQNLPTGEFYMPFAELPDMQKVILTGSDAHMPSPYLDAAPRRPIGRGSDSRGQTTSIRTLFIYFCFSIFQNMILSLAEGPTRPALSYQQHSNGATNSNTNGPNKNRSPMRGPMRGSHRATEE